MITVALLSKISVSLFLFYGLIDNAINKVEAEGKSDYKVRDDRVSEATIRVMAHMPNIFLFFAMLHYLYAAITAPATEEWSIGEAVYAICALGGVALRKWAILTLGHFFTFVVSIHKKHALVTYGPYRWLIHPSYTGVIVSSYAAGAFWGVPLWAIVPFFVLSLWQLRARIENEEKVLKDHFGKEWDEYASARYRLIPFIY